MKNYVIILIGVIIAIIIVGGTVMYSSMNNDDNSNNVQVDVADNNTDNVTVDISANNVSDRKQLQNCLEQYDTLITRMGISDITVPNIFRKQGSGRNRKNVPLTVKDIGEALRCALMEE